MSPDDLPGIAGEVAAQVAERIASADANASAMIAAASEAIDNANERAEEIARAAMETEIGRRVTGIETRGDEWHREIEGLRQDLNLLRSDLSRLSEAVAATATLVVATELTPEPAPLLSIPQASSNLETEPATAALAEVLPGSLASVAESPAAPIAPAPRKHRFL